MRRLAMCCAAVALLIGLLALSGWIFNVRVLRTFLVTGTEMKANTAVTLVLSSLALVLAASGFSVRKRHMIRFCAAVAGGIGLVTAIEHVFRWNPGFDELLFRDFSRLGTTEAGRMSAPTTFCFICLALALWMIDYRAGRSGSESAQEWRMRRYPAPWLALAAMFVPFQVFMAYMYGSLTPYGFGAARGYMAPQTALALMLLGAGVMASRTHRGVMRHLLAGTPFGSFLRRFLFVLLIVAPVMGWMVLNFFGGKDRPASYNVSMVVAISTVLFAFLAWWFARSLQRSEEAVRARARESVIHLEELQAVLNAMPTPVWIAHDVECRRITGNPASYQFLRTVLGERDSVDAVAGEPPPMPCHRIGGRSVAKEELPMQRAAATGQPQRDVEIEFVSSDGRSAFLLGDAVPLFDDAGRVRGAVGCFVDVTARRQAVEALRKSEALLRSITDNSEDMIFVKDRDSRIMFMNPAGLRAIGLTSQETLIGRTDTERHPDPIQAAAFEATDRRVIETRRTETIEEEFTSATGEKHILLTTKTPRWDAEGNVIGIVGIARNITARKKTEEALRESEKRFRQLANAMPQIVWTARPDGHVDYYNERWYEFTGFPRDSFGDQSWQPILHVDDAQHCYRAWYNAVQSGVPHEIECRLKDRRTGENRWHLGRAMPIRDEQGRIVRWFGTWTDIHDVKEAQEALAQHKARLEIAVAERTLALRDTIQQLETFSYSIVHDMRAPLRTMRSFASFLRDDYGTQLDERARDYIRRIANGADRLDTLIQDVLNYSRASKGEASIAPVALDRLVRDILAEYPDFHTRGSSIEVRDPLPVVLGNTALLTQCISNLIGNAVKFVPADREPHVVVRAERDGITARLVIEDNGIGIPADQKERIFELFQRLHSQTEYPGTGVGLAIVKRAVERMNGKLGIESEVGQGSRFWIELPVVGAPTAAA